MPAGGGATSGHAASRATAQADARASDVDTYLGGYGSDVIAVVDYDPLWALKFEGLRRVYADAMTSASVPIVAIEHVGSTSVPGLAAKPVVDCDIVVAERDVPAASEVMIGLGFDPLGELGVPFRWAFRAPEDLPVTNTYVVVEGSLSLRNHLGVRDVLRSDPGLCAEYAAVKRQTGETASDMEAYGRGKDQMIQRLLAAAGLSDAERASIGANVVPSHSDVPR